jgi:hypothetical protein
MDLSYLAVLASRFATFVLVFSVSACVLSKSISDDEKLGGKQEAKTVSTDDKQLIGQQKPVEVEKNDKAAQVDKANGKNIGAIKQPIQSAKSGPFNQVARQTPAKAGTIRATNQKVSKLATEGKLEKQPQQFKKEVAKHPVEAKKVVRYVSVDSLNVRMDSSEDAPVVGRLTKGTMYHVSIDGSWSKIGDSQYVMTKFLSNQPPKKTGSNWTFRK